MNTHKSIVNTLSKRGYLTLLALLIAITSRSGNYSEWYGARRD